MRGGFGIEAEGTRLLLPYRESGIRNEAAHEAVGRTFRFEVTEFDPERAQIMISRRRFADADRSADRAAILASLTEGTPVTGVVRSIVAFGAFVDIGGVDALLHISDASLEHVEDLNSLLRVGDHIEAVVRAVDVEKGKVSISRKSLLETGAREKLAGFEPGAILSGTVARFSDIFAFITLEDGVEGSVHVSEIAWGKRLQHPADELTEGQSVQVKVLSVDASARRVKLSIKQTSADPLASFGDTVAEGALVTGTISRIEDYGLFVKLQEGLEGLCHISDLSWTARPDRPTDVAPFKVGDSLEVRVLSVDVAARRLKLGLKQVSADPWTEAGDLTQVGTLLKATVTRFDKDAAYLRIAPDLEGRMHISEVSLDRVDSIRSALRIGQEVECMVIKSEALRRRLDLSVKAVAAKAEAETPKSYADADMSMSPLAAALAKVTGD
jgi:small subunit ribosomal protein S1